MADFLWTFAVEETLKKVLKVAGDQIGLVWGFEEQLSKLQKWLLKTEAFLRDINTRKLHHDSVRMWVDDLQHLVYEADDLLDEIVYQDLRQKVQARKMKKVCNFFSRSSNVFIFHRSMAKRMKILIELLEKHYNEAAPLGLVGNEPAGQEIDVISQFRETTSELIDDYEIVGRAVEVESIVKEVIDASNNQQLTSIFPIVGMGGLGKTTLAKLVINHEKIKEHFDKTVWVCVSQPFIVNKILREILQNLKGIPNGGDSKEVLLRELRKEMHGQRYFLVLDDVWNENVFLWDELKYYLLGITGNSENCIVVTTRNVDIAKVMETHPSHHLSKLSDDQCWFLFKESANACGLSMTSKFEIIQKELVKKIGGVPLVARVLGRAVKFEGDDERWVKMLESVLRTPLQEENFVLSILQLSVDHLPSSSLKQCFAYCSNFPNDFVFKKQELVQLWMAQSFLQPQEGSNNNTAMEDVGDVYFNILLSRCLFQDAFKDDEGRIISCKMHDLIHDIACAISSDQNSQLNHSDMLEKELQKKRSKKVASKLRMIDFVEKISHNIDQKMIDVMIGNFVNLRVLEMRFYSTKKLPYSIGQLKHLRYLEISSLKSIKLPKSIVLLYNLQTLKIGDLCTNFPKNFTDVINLRHFEFGHEVKKMPPHLSQLTQLQTLSNFVVGFEKGCKITELGPLKNLQGSLMLLCLEKVESEEEAGRANLTEKENLNELHLSWSVKRKDNRYNDLEVLEGLQPNKNLRSLQICSFAEIRLPNKIFVENLKVICLYGSKNCEKLPMLGQLNNLKELEIYRFHGVRSIDNEFYGNDSNRRTFFPKLERFVLNDMINLEQWEEIIRDGDATSNITTFPCLKELRIIRASKLLNIADVFGGCDQNNVQHLEELNISNCNKLTKLPNGLHFCGSTQRVTIDHCSNLNINLGNKPMLCYLSIGPLDKLPEELGHIRTLKEMRIFGCIQNYDFSHLIHLSSIKELHLIGDRFTNSVAQLPQQLQHLTSLQLLCLKHFGGIEALPEWMANFVYLQKLSLSHCPNLKQLPSKQAMLRLTKLSRLEAYECPQLRLDAGDTERAKLSHLPQIKIVLDDF